MKIRILFLTLLFVLLGITAHAAEEDRYIIKFNDEISLFSLDDDKIKKDYLSVSKDELQDYIDAGVVEYYEPDHIVKLAKIDNWNHTLVNAEFPKTIGCHGNDVKVGVIDTGIVSELKDQMLGGYNYVDENEDYTTTNDHGTQVSVIIGSETFGVASKVGMFALKCFDENGEGSVSDMVDAVLGAVNDFDCDVINMSCVFYLNNGETGQSRLLEEKIKEAVEAGVIFVAAAGNEGDGRIAYPGGYEDVISVASVNSAKVRSDFSNYNDTISVSAPGEGLYLFNWDEPVGAGTSLATPHVTALAAIAKCIDNTISQSGFAELISKTSEDLGEEGRDDYYGFGLLNCEAAVKELIKGQKFHISPVEKTNSATKVTIYNNTNIEETVCCIYAYYGENNKLVSCVPVERKIEAYQTYNFENPYKGGNVKYMVWRGLLSPTPLANMKTK